MITNTRSENTITSLSRLKKIPDNKVRVANMGPTWLCFYQMVLADLILAGSADPKILAEPICILSREISADPSRISWANPDQHPLTLKLQPFCLFAKQTETHLFQQMIWQNQSKEYLPFSQLSISNGCHSINNGKWVYFHFVCACMAFISDTNCHCDVTIESPCAQPWQPFKGPSVFPARDVVVKRKLHQTTAKL